VNGLRTPERTPHPARAGLPEAEQPDGGLPLDRVPPLGVLELVANEGLIRPNRLRQLKPKKAKLAMRQSDATGALRLGIEGRTRA
jgi:hypothetical protein